MLVAILFQVWPEGHREPRSEVGSQSLAESISEIRAGNLPIMSVMYYPTVSLSQIVY